MIELRHLRTLMALKESGSLTKAAKKRFLSQSALSHQIKELETRIDSQVFIRKSNPLSFTPEGTQLINLANKILPQIMATERLLKQKISHDHQRLAILMDCQHCDYIQNLANLLAKAETIEDKKPQEAKPVNL